MEAGGLVTCHSEIQKQEDAPRSASLISDVEASQEDQRKSDQSPSELSVPSFCILHFHSLLGEVKYSILPICANCL